MNFAATARVLRRVAALYLYSLPAFAGLCPDRPIRLVYLATPVLYDATQNAGLDKDFVDELQRRSKCRFDTEAMPRARAWKEIELGHVDMTTTVLMTPERDQTMWAINYYQMRNFLILDKDYAQHVKSLSDFLAAPQKPGLGRVLGYKYGDDFDTWSNALAAKDRVFDVVETDALYKMLKSKRIAAVLGTPLIYPSMLAKYALEDQVVILDLGGGSGSTPRALGLSKRNFSEADVRQWRTLIDGMQRDGTMRHLIGKYMGKKETEAMLLR